MTTAVSESLLLASAYALAKQTTSANRNNKEIANIPFDAFMQHRPQTLTECYEHGASVAKILADWQAGLELQAAGVLHSFVCKGALTAEQIEECCGPRVAFLCRQYHKILLQTPENYRHGKSQIIKRVKLYIAAYCDPDLVFLGVASLWDHFLLAKNSNASFQRLFADEAQDVMIPLLDMLGMQHLKTEVEEQVIQWGKSRNDYPQLIKRIGKTEEMRREVFALVQHTLQSTLPNAEIVCQQPTTTNIYNPHHPEKIHHEMLQKLVVDVKVKSKKECYTTFRWIHHLWQPVELGVVDNIGVCKLNGYQALQTTVSVAFGNNRIRVQFRIFTPEMEQVNQWGLAAVVLQNATSENLSNAWWNQRVEGYNKIKSATFGALPDILYVFTPQGQLFRFARGCSVVDYAYQVHSEVAHQCKRFRINGEAVGPATILHHLDLVELEQDPQFPGPNKAWLNAARTNRARGHIERFLNRQRHGQKYGQSVVNAKIRDLSQHYRIDIPSHRVRQTLQHIADRHNFDRVDELLSEIGAGRIPTDPILHPLFSEEVARQVELPNDARLPTRQIILAQCCKPRPGDEIIGRLRYKNQEPIRLKIHQANCESIADLSGAVPLKWRLQPRLDAVARLEMVALARSHLLQDALQLFSVHFPHITIHKVNAIARNGTARLSFTVEAKDQNLIDNITQSLLELPGHNINEVRQMQLSFPEREELTTTTKPASFNPYRRQPVQDRDMFFGRTEELARIRDMLRIGMGVVFVQGQKRVGKTSLLLYLRKHYLDKKSKMPVFIDFQLLGNLSGPSFYFEIASAVYHDLQDDKRLAYLEPPLQELFERDPTRQLADYLKSVKSYLGVGNLILMIDEFSRVIDAYQQNRIDDTLFQQWRGIIQATVPEVSYVMVVQQQTYDSLKRQVDQTQLAPIWHLLELGDTVHLNPLNKKDARQLIERPTLNHMEYSPQARRYVWQLTGGSPFLIQAFCFNLIRHMTTTGRRRVETADVDAVQNEFMNPNEGIFAHLLNVIKNIPNATPVCRHIAGCVNKPNSTVSLAQLEAALPHTSRSAITTALEKLTRQHILIEPEPGIWQFSALLFGRWLSTNRVLE